MTTIPQWVGQLVDATDLLLFFTFFFLISKSSRIQFNFIVAAIAIIIINFVDLWYNAASILLLPIVFFFGFKHSKAHRTSQIIYFLVAYFCTLLMANITGGFTMLLIKQPSDWNLFLVTSTILSILIQTGFYGLFLISKWLIDHLTFEDEYTKVILLTHLAGITTLFAILLVILRYFDYPKYFSFLLFVLPSSTLIVAAISTLTFYIWRIRRLKTSHQQERMADNILYVEQLQKSNEILRQFKHDYQNTLITLATLAQDTDANTVSTAINDIMKSTKNIDVADSQMMTLNHIKDPLIKSLIRSKLAEAQSIGVKFNMEINDDLPQLRRLSPVITRILGILLDNAVEASKETTPAEVTVAIIKDDDAIRLGIQNTISESVDIDLEKIFNYGYSTKGDQRGIGLSTVRDLINHHDDLLLSVAVTSEFMVTVTLLQ